jgi:hypothetical protein
MYFFVVEEWNGKRHHFKTEVPPSPTKPVGERLGREVERYGLTPEQAGFTLSMLIALAAAGVLNKYVPAPRAQTSTPECLKKLGLTQPTSREEIDKAFRALVKTAHPDRGGSHNLMIQLYQARERARKVVLA